MTGFTVTLKVTVEAPLCTFGLMTVIHGLLLFTLKSQFTFAPIWTE